MVSTAEQLIIQKLIVKTLFTGRSLKQAARKSYKINAVSFLGDYLNGMIANINPASYIRK